MRQNDEWLNVRKNIDGETAVKSEFNSSNEAFGFWTTAIAMLDMGKCRCLLPAQKKMQMIAVSATAFEGLAVRV